MSNPGTIPHLLIRCASVMLALAWLMLQPAGLASAGVEAARQCADQLGKPAEGPAVELDLPIRMLSWNLQKSSRAGWQQDLRELGANRNLLLFQEATAQASIAQYLPPRLYQAFAAGYTTEQLTTGVLTLSTGQPSLHCSLTAWEPWLGTPKATSVTEIPLAQTRQRLLVINIHMVNFTVGIEDFMKQVDALLPLIHKHAGPVILSGDFNTWSTTRAAYLKGFTAALDLSPVTFSPDHRTTMFKLPLDHVYVRGLRTLASRSVAVNTSDHNPLLVTLEIAR